MAINETIQPLNLSIIEENKTEPVNMIVTIFNDITMGFGGLAILVTLNILLVVLMYSEKGINLNFAKSLMASSFFTIAIGLILFSLGLVSDFRHLLYFIVEFGMAMFLVYNQKRKLLG